MGFRDLEHGIKTLGRWLQNGAPAFPVMGGCSGVSSENRPRIRPSFDMPHATSPGVLDFIQFSLAYHPLLSTIVVLSCGYMGFYFGWACYLLFRR